MPYKVGFRKGNLVYTQNGFAKAAPEIRGKISIKTITPEYQTKYKVKPGMITPYTRLLIIE